MSLKEQTERDKCGRISYGLVMIIYYLSYIGMFLHITLLGLAYKVEGVIS